MPDNRNRSILTAAWFAILILLASLPVDDTHAFDLNETLIDLFEKTVFGAAGTDMEYDRLLLWEKKYIINLHVAQDVDGITLEWLEMNMNEIMQSLGSNAPIRLMGVVDPLDADILIISSKNKDIFSDGIWSNILKRKYGFSEEKYKIVLENIEEIYSTPHQGWFWTDTADVPNKKRILGYVSIIEPEYRSFKAHLVKSIFTALGYGHGQFVENVLKSVHTRSDHDGIEGADYLILHFLYNSGVKNAMPRKAAVESFRRWLSSDYFKKNVRIRMDNE